MVSRGGEAPTAKGTKMAFKKTAYKNFKADFTMTAAIKRSKGGFTVIERREDRPEKAFAKWYGIKTASDAESFIKNELGYKVA